MTGSMTIGKLAAAGGVGVETIRYYQRRGLLPQPASASASAGAGAGPGASGLRAGVRRYDQADMRRLRFIRSAQAAGFTLDEIAELLALDAGDDRSRAHALATARIAALDARIADLTAARSALAALASDCAAGGAGRCPIIAAFERG